MYLNPQANFSLTWQVNRRFRNDVPTGFMKVVVGGSVSPRDVINAFTEKKKSRGTSLKWTSENPHGRECHEKGFALCLHIIGCEVHPGDAIE